MNNEIHSITYESHIINPILYISCLDRKRYCLDTNQSTRLYNCIFFTDDENNAYISYEANGLQYIHKLYDFDTRQKFIKKIFITDAYACILTFCDVLYRYKNPFTLFFSEVEKRIFPNIHIKYMHAANDAIIIISDKNFSIISDTNYMHGMYNHIFKNYSKRHEISSIKKIFINKQGPIVCPVLVVVIQDINDNVCLYSNDNAYSLHYLTHLRETEVSDDVLMRDIIGPDTLNIDEINIGNVISFHCSYRHMIFVDTDHKLYIATYSEKEHIVTKIDISDIVDGEITSVFSHQEIFYYETHDGIFKINSRSLDNIILLLYCPTIMDNLYSEKIDNFYFDRNEIVQKIPTKSAASI